MDTFLICASVVALAVNLVCIAWNIRQMFRYYRGLQVVRELLRLHLEICLGTWNMRHWPTAMRVLQEERLRQINEVLRDGL